MVVDQFLALAGGAKLQSAGMLTALVAPARLMVMNIYNCVNIQNIHTLHVISGKLVQGSSSPMTVICWIRLVWLVTKSSV